MTDHKHGEMDIKAQEAAYAGFISFATRSAVAILVALILMAIFWI